MSSHRLVTIRLWPLRVFPPSSYLWVLPEEVFVVDAWFVLIQTGLIWMTMSQTKRLHRDKWGQVFKAKCFKTKVWEKKVFLAPSAAAWGSRGFGPCVWKQDWGPEQAHMSRCSGVSMRSTLLLLHHFSELNFNSSAPSGGQRGDVHHLRITSSLIPLGWITVWLHTWFWMMVGCSRVCVVYTEESYSSEFVPELKQNGWQWFVLLLGH